MWELFTLGKFIFFSTPDSDGEAGTLDSCQGRKTLPTYYKYWKNSSFLLYTETKKKPKPKAKVLLRTWDILKTSRLWFPSCNNIHYYYFIFPLYYFNFYLQILEQAHTTFDTILHNKKKHKPSWNFETVSVTQTKYKRRAVHFK